MADFDDLPPTTSLGSPFYNKQKPTNANQSQFQNTRQPIFLNQTQQTTHTPGGRRVRAVPFLNNHNHHTPGNNRHPTPTLDTPRRVSALRLRTPTHSHNSRNHRTTPLMQQPSSNNRRKLNSLWVTAFGFEATKHGSDVLTLFESFGDILDHRPGLKNSIDLMFSTKEEAEYALANDGLRVNIGADRTTCIMIGVKPCNNPPSSSSSLSASSSALRTPVSRGLQSGNRSVVSSSGASISSRRSTNRRMRTTTPKSSGRSRGRKRVQKFVAPPEMETESRHGRSTFQHSNQGNNQRYAAVRSSGYRREPRKDLSCCQMALRYLWPADY